MRNQVIVGIRIVDGLSLAESLQAAAVFGYQNNAIAEFSRGGETYRAWYDEILQDYQAARIVDGEKILVARDNNRWGSLQEPQ